MRDAGPKDRYAIVDAGLPMDQGRWPSFIFYVFNSEREARLLSFTGRWSRADAGPPQDARSLGRGCFQTLVWFAMLWTLVQRRMKI